MNFRFIIKSLLTIFILLFLGLSGFLFADNDAVVQENFQKWQKASLEIEGLRLEREKQIDFIQKHITDPSQQHQLIKAKTKQWKKETLEAAIARQKFNNSVVRKVNKGLSPGQHIQETLGTPLLLGDPSDNVVNPESRVYDADQDFGGSPEATKKLTEEYSKYGIKADDTGHYTDYKATEVTVNKEIPLKQHSDPEFSKDIKERFTNDETYVSQHKELQKSPLKDSMLSNDHANKATKGFGMTAPSLRKDRNATQLMLKGTKKASSILSTEQKQAALDRAYKKTGHSFTVDEIDEMLKDVKQGEYIEAHHINDNKKMKAVREACRELTIEAMDESEKIAAKEKNKINNRINKLKEQSKNSGLSVEERDVFGKKAKEWEQRLTKAEGIDNIGREEINKKINVKPSDRAEKIDELKSKAAAKVKDFKKGSLQKVDDIKARSKKKLKDLADGIPRSKAAIKEYLKTDWNKTKGNFTEKAKSALNAMKNPKEFLKTKMKPQKPGLLSIAMTTISVSEKVVNEEEPGDHPAKTYVKVVGLTTAELTGIPEVGRTYRDAFMENADLAIKELKILEGEKGRKLTALEKVQFTSKYTSYILVDFAEKGTKKLWDGVKDMANMPAALTQWSGGKFSEYVDGVDKHEDELKVTVMENRITKYRMEKLKELTEMKDDLEKNWDRQKAILLAQQVNKNAEQWSRNPHISQKLKDFQFATLEKIQGSIAEQAKKQAEMLEKKYAEKERMEAGKLSEFGLNESLNDSGVKEKLGQSSKDIELALPDFEIKSFLDEVNGAPLKDYVSTGDIVAFSADVEHPLFDGDPKPSEIFWQLYDDKDNPVPGVQKRKQTYEGGIIKPYSFRFRIDSLSPGTYKVGMTHYLLEDQDIKTQASTSFKIFDAVSIQEIVVTDTPGGKEHMSFLTNDKLPHIYVYYTLANGVESADATITVMDSKTGESITSITQTRPKEKQYLGIRLEKTTLKSRQKLKVVAKITTSDKKTKTLESRFGVGFYQVRISLPSYFKSGEAENFRVSLPKNFKAPFSVDFNTSSGVVAGHTNHGLTGTVTGIATDYDMAGWLEATVKDSTGRIAEGIANFIIRKKTTIEAKPVVASIEKAGNRSASSYSLADRKRLNWCYEQGIYENSAASKKCRQWDKEAGYENRTLTIPEDFPGLNKNNREKLTKKGRKGYFKAAYDLASDTALGGSSSGFRGYLKHISVLKNRNEPLKSSEHYARKFLKMRINFLKTYGCPW